MQVGDLVTVDHPELGCKLRGTVMAISETSEDLASVDVGFFDLNAKAHRMDHCSPELCASDPIRSLRQ